jgi:hypothetical protein
MRMAQGLVELSDNFVVESSKNRAASSKAVSAESLKRPKPRQLQTAENKEDFAANFSSRDSSQSKAHAESIPETVCVRDRFFGYIFFANSDDEHDVHACWRRLLALRTIFCALKMSPVLFFHQNSW